MSTVTINEEEFLRLKEKAGEVIIRDPSICRRNGHTWKFLGGTNAGCCRDCCCSIDVHECIVCGDCDYGENAEASEVVANCADRETIEFEDGQDVAALQEKEAGE